MIKREIKATIFLLIGLIVFCLMMYGLVKYTDFSGMKMAVILIALFAYSFFALWIGNKINDTKNRLLKIIIYTLSAPIAVLILLLKLLGPFMIISMSFIMYFACSVFAPVIIISIINGVKEIPIEMI